ncbi:MAG: DUF2079 domain-containing protein [Actinobacteria bacterium]|nr:DUF2079 domain-containing protein [Actinomycetota bacterium]
MARRWLPRDPVTVAAAALTIAAAAGMSWAALYRHQRFGSNAYDLGIFDQAVWGYSRFEWIPNTVLRLPHTMGDHFHPILVVLAPLYWVWDDARVLLVAQAALLAGAGIPIFLWAREKLDGLPALAFLGSYLAFWAVLGGSIFDFHELAFAAPIVSAAIYAALTRRTILLWVCAVLGLLTREDVALTFVGLAVFIALVQRRWQLGVALATLGAAWFVVAYKVVIPALAGRDYAHWAYSRLGADPASALMHVVTNPIDSIRTFLTPRDKQIALANLFAPWLGLPLLSPLVLVMLPTLAARFLSDKPSHWAPQGFHYSLMLAPIIAFAAVDTTRRVAERLDGRARTFVPLALALLTVAAGLHFSFVRIKPLDELHRYTPPERVADIEACLEIVPPDSSVAATSALVPHLTHRRSVFVLDDRPVPRTRFLAIDASTWTFPLDQRDLGRLVRRSIDRGYGIRCSRGSTVVLEQGAPSGALSPELRRLFEAG